MRAYVRGVEVEGSVASSHVTSLSSPQSGSLCCGCSSCSLYAPRVLTATPPGGPGARHPAEEIRLQRRGASVQRKNGWRECCRCFHPGLTGPPPRLPERSAPPICTTHSRSLSAPTSGARLAAGHRVGKRGCFTLTSRRSFRDYADLLPDWFVRRCLEVGSTSSRCRARGGVPGMSGTCWPPACCLFCSTCRRLGRLIPPRAESAKAKGRSAQVGELLLGCCWAMRTEHPPKTQKETIRITVMCFYKNARCCFTAAHRRGFGYRCCAPGWVYSDLCIS